MQDVNCFIMPVGWSVGRSFVCLLGSPACSFYALSIPRYLFTLDIASDPLSFIFSSCFTCSTAASQQVNKFIVTRRAVNYLGQSEVKCSSGCWAAAAALFLRCLPAIREDNIVPGSSHHNFRILLRSSSLTG